MGEVIHLEKVPTPYLVKSFYFQWGMAKNKKRHVN